MKIGMSLLSVDIRQRGVPAAEEATAAGKLGSSSGQHSLSASTDFWLAHWLSERAQMQWRCPRGGAAAI